VSFIENLATRIAAGVPGVTTTVNAEPATIPADLAPALGLRLNELLTNAYKYAYPEGAGGEVRVEGKCAEGGRYCLQVADFGRGLPPGFDITRATGSLGMRVVTSVAAQLGGEIEAKSTGHGACFTLTFPTGQAGERSARA